MQPKMFSSSEDCTENWDQFKNVVNETAKSVLGPKQRMHQDWFDTRAAPANVSRTQ